MSENILVVAHLPEISKMYCTFIPSRCHFPFNLENKILFLETFYAPLSINTEKIINKKRSRLISEVIGRGMEDLGSTNY